MYNKKCVLLGEVVNNAAAAVMFILGGQSDCKYRPSRSMFPFTDNNNNKNNNGSSYSNSYNSNSGCSTSGANVSTGIGGMDYYMAGWIDAQVWSEGLPGLVVRYLLTAISDEPVPGQDTIELSRIPSFRRGRDKDGYLPRAAGMHLAQALFQLTSRAQNRQMLCVTGAPYALCSLFVSAVGVKQRQAEVCSLIYCTYMYIYMYITYIYKCL
jgi:hypothetical protein